MANWTSILQSKIHSRIKNNFPDTLLLSGKYGMYELKKENIEFTTMEQSLQDPTFPTIKNRLLPMQEIGRDLEGISINGVTATMQTDCLSDESETEAKAMADEVIEIYKSMRFEITSFPDTKKENDYWRSIIRARRTIGGSDSL